MKILMTILLAFSCSVLAADSDVVTVKGKGVGVNETAALKDAYRDAVETAVGLYVDAEQMVKNDEVVEDQILTQSNACIEGYDVLKKTMENGVCTIKILAKVKTKALTKKLSTTMKTQTVEVGSGLRNLYAKEASKKKSGEDGSALLRSVLTKLEPVKQLMDVVLTDVEPIVLNKDDDKSKEVKLGYLFKQTISEDRYFNEFMPPLREVLRQVAISGPGKMSLSVSEREQFSLADCLRRRREGYDWYETNAKVVSPQLGGVVGGSSSPILSSESKKYVILVVGVNKLRTLYTCETYEVDKFAAKEFDEWKRGKIYNCTDQNIMLSYEDEDGEELAQATVSLREHEVLKCCDMARFDRGGCLNFLALAPFRVHDKSSCFEHYAWREVSLHKEALPLVKKIKVDLVK